MYRLLPRFAAAAVLVLSTAVPASAQQLTASGTLTSALLFPVAPIVVPEAGAPAPATSLGLAAREQTPRPAAIRPAIESRRPALLPTLYVSAAALQLLDAHSTYAALDRGGREANPLMKGVVGNRGAMLAVKAGVTAGTIWAAERMWRRGNRVGAIAMMAIVNGVTAAVVAHNYQVASRLR